MSRLTVLHFQRKVDRDVGVTQWITRGERHPAAGGSWYVEVDRESGKDDTEEGGRVGSLWGSVGST